jgi:ribokinase
MLELFAPRAGQRLSDIDALALNPSGSATIIASAAHRLGARVSLVTAVGDDELGTEWKRRVEVSGIDTSGVVTVPGQLTPIAISTVDADGEKSYAFYRFQDICDPLAELELDAAGAESAAGADVLVITEAVIRGARSRAAMTALLEQRRRLGLGPTVLSVNYRASSWADPDEAPAVLGAFAALVDTVCCNRSEFAVLGDRLAGPQVVFETLGADGVNVRAHGAVQHVPAREVPEVVLDTGAGDTFCAAVAVALAEGSSPLDAAVFGSATSALAISREGLAEAVPSRAEVDRVLASDQPLTPATPPRETA